MPRTQNNIADSPRSTLWLLKAELRRPSGVRAECADTARLGNRSVDPATARGPRRGGVGRAVVPPGPCPPCRAIARLHALAQAGCEPNKNRGTGRGRDPRSADLWSTDMSPATVSRACCSRLIGAEPSAAASGRGLTRQNCVRGNCQFAPIFHQWSLLGMQGL